MISKTTTTPRVFHPFLLAVHPVLFLYAQNADLVPWTELLAPVCIAVLLVAGMWLGLWLLSNNRAKSALLISIAWLLFFSYGHIRNVVVTLVPSGLHLARSQYLLPLLGLIFALTVFCVLRTRRKLAGLTRFLNITAVFLLVIAIAQIGYGHLTRYDTSQLARLQLSANMTPDEMPDIYYIILDGYARADMLEEMYNYDNSGFLEELKKRSFFIAEESRPNYCMTVLSLASSLNLTYLDSLAERVGQDSRDRSPVQAMLWDHAVARNLRKLGYQYVVFESCCSITDRAVADIYATPGWSPRQLGKALLRLTPVPFLLHLLARPLAGSQYARHRGRLLFTFDHLADFAGLAQPVFVFAHILAPHPPFVFDEHGQPVNPQRPFTYSDGQDFIRDGGTAEEYVTNYRRQLVFVNQKVLHAVDDILSGSTRPAVIILQGDHGTRLHLDWEDISKTYFKEPFSILNAYRLPDESDPELYGNISPVNTFRVVFNCYFDAGLPLLPDRSYYCRWKRPYEFVDVTDYLSGE